MASSGLASDREAPSLQALYDSALGPYLAAQDARVLAARRNRWLVLVAGLALAGGLLAWVLRRHTDSEIGPMIDQLYRRLHEMAAEEVSRTVHKMPELGEAGKAQLEELARRIVNKMLHDPVTTLRQSEGHGPETGYLHALEKLFRLERDPSSPSSPAPTTPASPG